MGREELMERNGRLADEEDARSWQPRQRCGDAGDPKVQIEVLVTCSSVAAPRLRLGHDVQNVLGSPASPPTLAQQRQPRCPGDVSKQ
jgi:hypothetical protein